MTASRTQHLVASTIILLVALSVGWLSFTREPADAFLFPRLISIFFMFLAAWNFIRAALSLSKVGEGLDLRTTVRFVPGLIVTLVYFFWAAKTLGFYASSTLTFFIIYTLYDPASPFNPMAWIKRAVVTVIFMSVIFGLFTTLLQVYAPRGWFDGDVIPVYEAIIQPLKDAIAYIVAQFSNET